MGGLNLRARGCGRSPHRALVAHHGFLPGQTRWRAELWWAVGESMLAGSGSGVPVARTTGDGPRAVWKACGDCFHGERGLAWWGGEGSGLSSPAFYARCGEGFLKHPWNLSSQRFLDLFLGRLSLQPVPGFKHSEQGIQLFRCKSPAE